MADSLLRLIFQGDTTDAKKAIGGLKDSFGEFKDFAVGLLAGISFAKIIKESYDLGVMLSDTKVKIQTAIGDSGELLEDTLGITRDLFKTTDVTFGQATDMMVIFRNTMGLTNDQIKEQKDAWETWMDITGKRPEILSATDQMMRALEVDTFEGKKEILDYTIAIQRLTPIGLDPLMSALTSTAPLMKAFGMSSKEQIAFLGFMAEAGLDAGSATMMFNQAIRNVKTPAELYELMNTIKNTSDDLEAAQIASDVFGARGGAKLAAALRSGKMGIDELIASLDKSTGAFDAAGKAVEESYSEKLGIMKNKLADIGMTIGEGLVTSAMPLVDWISATGIPAVQGFIDLFSNGLGWIKKGWDALPPGVQSVIEILGGLGIAFTVLKTLLIGHPLILMATILAGVVIGVGRLMEALVPVEDKWKAIGQAAFETGQKADAANLEQIKSLGTVKKDLSELANLQNQIQTDEVLKREQELVEEINKLAPAMTLTIDASGQLSSAYGSDVGVMISKTDELIQKIADIRTAERAQAEASKEDIESQIHLLENLIAQKSAQAEKSTSRMEWQAQQDVIRGLNDQLDVLKGNLAEVDGKLGSMGFDDFKLGAEGVVESVGEWSSSLDGLKLKYPELTAALQLETGNMVKAMWDSGFSLEEATTAGWKAVYDAAIAGGANQKTAAALAAEAVLTIWKNNGADLTLLAKTNALSAASAFAESIYDGLADKASLVASAVQYIADMMTINDAYGLGQTITSDWVAGMVSTLESDTRLSRGVTRISDMFGHSLPEWAKNIYAAGYEISSTWAAGIAAGMSEDTKIAAAMAAIQKQLMPGGLLPPISGGAGSTGLPGLGGTETWAPVAAPTPMPTSFVYWNELVAFLKTSYPVAMMGEPKVSLVPATMYKTAANWTDPGGKNWTIFPWGYAEGGLVTRPTWAPIAENRPEYVFEASKLDAVLAAILQALTKLGGVNRFDQRLSVEVEAGPGSILELAAKGLRIRG